MSHVKGTKELKQVHLADGSIWKYVIDKKRIPHSIRIYSPDGTLFRPTLGQLESVGVTGHLYSPSQIKRFVLERLVKHQK